MYTVMFSGGRTSAEALRRTLEITTPDNVVALFADTKTEDEDLYRFVNDVSRKIHPVTAVADGRDIWELFREEKFIGNTRVDICSATLKRDLCRKWIRENAPNSVIVLGLDWTEPHRIERSKARWGKDGFDTFFPLAERPLYMENDYSARLREIGIDPPRLYAMGFEHNNCGGACVKAGQGQWAKLFYAMPERYSWHEEQEQITRAHIGKDVSILRDSRGGTLKPLTLRDFRLRLQGGEKPADSIFSCNCVA